MSPGARPIDINADVGEGLDDTAFFPLVTSVSIACGGHAGDSATMGATVAMAMRAGLLLGAHPAYPDRDGFGRRVLDISLVELRDSLLQQLGDLGAIVERAGGRLTHVKVHGALYNRAWNDLDTASLVVDCARVATPGAAIFGPPGSALLQAAEAASVAGVAEAFLDRAYGSDGTLRSRDVGGAVIGGEDGLQRQLAYLRGMAFRTVCVHSDNPAGVELLVGLRAALRREGMRVAPYLESR
ncbi:MAG TPA: LamB/YcsF family protein [Candidatus Dormibacteraeota bacterium]